MKRLIAVSFVVAALMFAAFPQAASRTLPPAGVTALNTFLSGQASRGVIPGVVAVVVNQQGTLYSGAFGKQNTAKDVPLAADSIFRIASMTKAVTSVATMMMVEQGKLKLDDDVSMYLPAFKSMRVLTTTTRRRAPTRRGRTRGRSRSVSCSRTPPASATAGPTRASRSCSGRPTRAARPRCRSCTSPARSGRTAPAPRCWATSSRSCRASASTSSPTAHRHAARHGRHLLRGAHGASTRAS